MLFNADCTLYNRFTQPTTRLDSWRKCVLQGVCWQGDGAVKQRKLLRSGNTMLYIPFAVNTPGGERFVLPHAFKHSPDGSWTLQEGDILFHGIVEEDPASLQSLLEERDGAVVAVSVCAMHFGSKKMWHWEVCGR